MSLLRSPRLATGTLVLALALAACDDTDPVAAWLVCDCPVELARIVALGDAKVDTLTLALRTGPSVAERDNYRAQLAEEHRLARRFRDSFPGVSSISDSATFTDEGVANLVAQYQKRAAWALRGIGTVRARQELHQAWLDHMSGSVPWRPDVRAEVELLDREEPITSVTVLGATDVAVGASSQLTVRVRGAALVTQAVTWVSSDAARVAVSAGGLVTRVAPGPAVVTACSAVSPAQCGSVTISMP